MTRLLLLICLAISLVSMGCCGMIGPGCGIPGGCNDCDGLGTNTLPMGPLDSIRQLRKQMVCGSGCGEVYVGEWISTPPHAVDPCCGTDWVGGATRCQPFCWEQGTLIRGLLGNLAGQRFCDGDQSSQPCGCDSCSAGMNYVETNHVQAAPVQHSVGTSSCGCTACNKMPGNTRMAGGHMIMSQRAMDARVDRIRR